MKTILIIFLLIYSIATFGQTRNFSVENFRTIKDSLGSVIEITVEVKNDSLGESMVYGFRGADLGLTKTQLLDKVKIYLKNHYAQQDSIDAVAKQIIKQPTIVEDTTKISFEVK